MLWVRIPPEPLIRHVLAEQPGVLATLSRWRSGVRIPSGTLARHGTQFGKAAKLKPSCVAGSTPARATHRVAFLTAACKAAVAKQVRWMTRGSIPSQPNAMFANSDGPLVYRHRTPASHAGKMGSIPMRVTQNRPGGGTEDTQRSERCAHRGVGVRLSPWSLLQVRQVPSRLS